MTVAYFYLMAFCKSIINDYGVSVNVRSPRSSIIIAEYELLELDIANTKYHCAYLIES